MYLGFCTNGQEWDDFALFPIDLCSLFGLAAYVYKEQIIKTKSLDSRKQEVQRNE